MDKDVKFALERIRGSNSPVARMARNSGVSTSTIYRWKKGLREGKEVRPQLTTVKFVMKTLGYGFAWVPPTGSE